MFRISAPHFVAGFVFGERYAPIIQYMREWSILDICKYCAKKGWTLESLD